MSYTKQELIEYVKSVAQNEYKTWCNDKDVFYVDIRLQLHNKDYRCWTGDNSYDTDHRGFWGASSVLIRDEEEDIYDEDGELIVEDNNDYDDIAKEIVEQALDNFLQYLNNCTLEKLKQFAEENDITEDDIKRYTKFSRTAADRLRISIYCEIANGGRPDIYFLTPLETTTVENLQGRGFEFVTNSQDIEATLDQIGITDEEREIGSLYYEYCDGEIGEVYYLKELTPHFQYLARRIR